MARAAAAPHDFSISKCPPNCVVSKVLSPIEPSRLSDYNLPSSILNLWPTRRPGCSHPGCRPLVLRCGSGSGRNVHRSGNYSRCRYTPSRRCIAAASAPPSAPVFRRSRTTPSAVLSHRGTYVLQLSESVLSRAREQRRLLGRTWRRERQREGVNAASRVLSRCSELVLGYEHQ